MADKKISELTAASAPLSGAELLEVVQGGNSRKIDADAIADRVAERSKVWSGAQQFARTAGTIATTTGTDFDNSGGEEHTRTVAANITFTVSSVPSGCVFDMRVLITYTSGTITWFSGVEWVGDEAPTLTGGKVYEFIFTTIDGGTTWHAASGEYDG